jgi:replicative DNA helicase
MELDQYVTYEREAILIGDILSDPRVMNEVCDILTGDEFTLVIHQCIYQVLLERHQQGKPLDFHSMHEVLRDHPMILDGYYDFLEGYLASRRVVYGPYSVDWAKAIAKAHLCRGITHEVGKTLSDISNKTLGYDDAINEIETLSDRLPKQTAVTGNMGTVMDQFLSDIENRTDQVEGVIKCGIEGVDNVITDFQPGHVMTVGGYSSHGKSAVVVHYVKRAIEEKKRILIASCEMDEKAYFRRIMSLQTGIPYRDMMMASEVTKELADGLAAFALLDPQIHYMMSPTPREVFNAIVSFKPDLVAVDYLQAMSLSEYGKQIREDQRLAEFYKQMKSAAQRRGFAAIIASQMRRPETGNTIGAPTKHRTKDGDAPTVHADHVAIVWWPSKEDSEINPTYEFVGGQLCKLNGNDKYKMNYQDSYYEIDVAKNRQGVTRTVPCLIVPQTNKIVSLNT